MQSQFQISVIIPAYNAERTVSRTIQSVLGQSLPASELIVVDDGSVDGTGDVCRGFGDDVKYVRQENAGAPTARNHGISLAQGDWIALLDADDEWEVDRLEAQADILAANPEIQWASGGYSKFRSGVHRRDELLPETTDLSGSVIDYFDLLRHGCDVWTGTVLVRRKLANDVGLLDPRLLTSDDSDFWIRLAAVDRKLVFINRPIARYHIQADGNLAMTRVKRRDASIGWMCRKHVDLVESLDSRDAKTLREHLSTKLVNVIHSAIRQGAYDMAGELIDEGIATGFLKDSGEFTRQMRIPSSIRYMGWRTKKSIGSFKSKYLRI